VGNIDVESGVHLFIRIIGGRVLDDGDLVTKLGGIANGRLDTRMRDKSDDDESMDSVFLKLHIQISVCKSTRAPMLRRDDVARVRLEPGTNLATPCAVFKGLAGQTSFLDRRDIFPSFIIARTVTTMHRIENAELRLPCCVQNLQHIRNTVVGLSHALDAIPYLTSLRNEIVVRIND